MISEYQAYKYTMMQYGAILYLRHEHYTSDAKS